MNLGATELLLILAVVLIVFGAGKLPKVMGELGKGLKNFKDAAKDVEQAASDETKDDEKKS